MRNFANLTCQLIKFKQKCREMDLNVATKK